LEQKAAFPGLPIAEGAAFDSYLNQHVSGCLLGTRTELLQRISNWAVSPQGECIFWLRGMAGTGKSAVAQTVAGSWKNKGLLGASFFFKRGEGDCGNATKFFSTIAQQLMITTPGLQSAIRKAIEDEPNIRSKSLREQFEKLLLHPILATAHDRSRRIILVIDALDECAEEEDIQILVRLLSQIQRPDFTPLRIFITSRPELPIRLSFQQLGINYKEFALHDIAMDKIGNDISIFLKERLTSIRQLFILRGRQLPLSWPGEENIKAMTAMTVPLFIFAATVCRLLEDDQWNPVDTLNEVLVHQSDVSKLDGTYLPVLNRILIKQPEAKKTRLTREYKNVIGFIILLEHPLSVISLARLIGIPKETIHTRLDSLHSVFSIPADETEPVRPFHLSFRDFLVDAETKEKTPFWVNENDMHREIANRCLTVLNQDLQKNICRIPNYGIKRVDIPYTLVKKHLTEEIQYACRYWIQHTCQCQVDAAQIESVFKFLRTHYTHWLEAMSILGLISEAVKSINKFSTHITVSTRTTPRIYSS
jgi:NACHT domain